MLSLAVYVHDIDPVALWPVRWYGLSYLAGFLVAFLLIRRVARVGVSSLAVDRVGDFVVTVAIGLVVGGRLGYVLFYDLSLLYTFERTAPWWNLLAINKGGMASHGGLLGAMLGCFYFAWRHGHRPLYLIDLVGFGAPLGLFFGRVANFINGELYGRACDPGFPLAVKFPQEMLDMEDEQLVGIIASVPPHREFDDFDSLYTCAIKVIDWIQAGDAQVRDAIAPYLTARHPSQLYAGVLEGLVVFAVLALLWRRPRKPGTIMFGFFASYGVLRIVNELFRMPDAHLGFQALGLTRGQWLSVPLVAVGVIGLVWVTLRQADPVGAWRRGAWTRVGDEAQSDETHEAQE